MKSELVEFDRPVKILQVFRNINLYGKSKRSIDDRRAELEWRDIQSNAGHVVDGQLFLPESITTEPEFHSCSLISIEDDNRPQVLTSADLQLTKLMAIAPRLPEVPTINRCFNLVRPDILDIFELRMASELEVHLHYGYFEVGIPKRNNFKLCEVKYGQPVEVKINGKKDASLTAGAERIFKEQHYVFQYLGDFSRAVILREPFPSVLKQVPSERKVVDMIKQLW